MKLDVHGRAGQHRFGRPLFELELRANRCQVIVDAEGDAQLVGTAVDAAPLARVFLQDLKVNQKRVLRRHDALPQCDLFGVGTLARRVYPVHRFDQVRRCSQFA